MPLSVVLPEKEKRNTDYFRHNKEKTNIIIFTNFSVLVIFKKLIYIQKMPFYAFTAIRHYKKRKKNKPYG